MDSLDAGTVCPGLFGRPNEHTGVNADQCGPTCTCDGKEFAPPVYSEAFVQSLTDDWQLATPGTPLSSDPYTVAAPAPAPAGTVCGILPQGSAKPRQYAVVTYASEAEATAAGAKITHAGRCGLCSTLQNLAVYLRKGDLTGPVRSCGLQSGTDQEADVQCLMKLGFDRPCAQIWGYNTAHTRSRCLDICIEQLDAPYNLPDGGLNPCIQCDEDSSGAVFKAVAGRTRRNSGLADEICRPCAQVYPLVQAY